jgi:hypothetical protein
VPAGSLSKAALVGAKTVNGPALDNVSTNPAALTAATRVVWSAELTAFSTIFLVLNIGAPPTIGFESIIICALALCCAIVSEHTATSSIRKVFFTVLFLPEIEAEIFELEEYTEGFSRLDCLNQK